MEEKGESYLSNTAAVVNQESRFSNHHHLLFLLLFL